MTEPDPQPAEVPGLQPLCRNCVRDLPVDDRGLCAFCLTVRGEDQ